MRITLFSILFLITTPLFSVSYNQTREDFKLELYYCQQGLMDKNNYYEFIEPYMQEAEKTLRVPKYCMENPDSDASKDYLRCLIRYNVACFHEYVISHSPAFVFASKAKKVSKQRLKERKAYLLQALENLKNEMSLHELNIQNELRSTVDLFKKANAKYYKKLGIKFKLFYPFMTLFNTPLM